MKVLAFVGSPRKGGNTDVLMDRIIEGSRERGAEVEKIYLNDLNVRMCQACDSCRKHIEDPCVLKDDMVEVHDKLRACDAFVVGTPIYYFGPSAQTKAFLDRWYALAGAEGEGHSLKGKRMALALAYADPNPFCSGAMNAYNIFRDAAAWVGVDLVGVVYGTGWKPGEISGNAALMEEAVALGRRLCG